jgi:TorA maturation chaperone TorD
LGSGVLNPNAAFPYESVYTSTHALLMQEARDEVLALYRSQGIDKDPSWTDPEDHISLELTFMQVLCERCAEAVEIKDDKRARALIRTQYGFLTNHLLSWVPRFCIDVPRYAVSGLYHGFADLTSAFLEDDKALLEDIAKASGIELEQSEPTPISTDSKEETHA